MPRSRHGRLVQRIHPCAAIDRARERCSRAELEHVRSSPADQIRRDRPGDDERVRAASPCDRRRRPGIGSLEREGVGARAEVHVQTVHPAVRQPGGHAQAGQCGGGQRSRIGRRVGVVVNEQRHRRCRGCSIDRQRTCDVVQRARAVAVAAAHGEEVVVAAAVDRRRAGGGRHVDLIRSGVAVDGSDRTCGGPRHHEPIDLAEHHRTEVHVEYLDRTVGQAARTHAQAGECRGGQIPRVRRGVPAVVDGQGVTAGVAVDRQRSGDGIDRSARSRSQTADANDVVAGAGVDGRGARSRLDVEGVGPGAAHQRLEARETERVGADVLV